MSNELQVLTKLVFSKGGVTESMGSTTPFNVSVSGTHCLHATQALTTTPEVLATGDAGSTGFAMVKNLSVNAVHFHGTDGGNTVFASLKQNESCLFRLADAILVSASSGTATIEVMVISD